MKVIFLDHDGVICLSPQWGGRFKKQEKWCKKHGPTPDEEMPVEYRFDNFDNKAVKVLNEILKETGAEIVVSSDWRRYCTLEEMQDLYEKYGVIKKPIALTSIAPTHFSSSGAVNRANEIHIWLKENPQVKSWVAVDDLNMAKHRELNGAQTENDWGLTHFVLTPKSAEGIKQSGIKDKIVKFLI